MREVVSLVFGIREAKLTIAKDEGGKVDFFLSIWVSSPRGIAGLRGAAWAACHMPQLFI